MEQKNHFWSRIDKKVFFIGGIVCLIFVLWAVIWPAEAANTFDHCLNFFTQKFGWLYLLVVTCFVVFLVWLCCSKYGKIPLGKDGEKPEYSTLSWFFMLFAAGMGIGLVFWSVAEPISHFADPPFGTANTVEAAETAMKYSFMHWGLHPWACFGVVGLPLAYFQFRKGKPALLSTCLIPLIGEEKANGVLGSIVNVLAVFATVFGVATSLGLGAMQINSGLHYVFGVPTGNIPLIIIVVTVTLLFISSAVSGISKGIKILSDTNMVIAAVLLVFVLIVGPTLFILNFFISALGDYLNTLFSTCTWTDAFSTNEGWLGRWTIFYWAWWISWGPFVGGFIARISKGRTIREFIIGTLVCPVLLSFVFIGIMGGSALYGDINSLTDIAGAMADDVSYALFALLGSMPLAKVTSIIALLLISVFFITSADSSTFVCSMMTAKGVQEPPNSLKIFWGISESAVAIILLLVGGLTSLQTASIVGAFPFMIICILLVFSFMKALREDPLIREK